MIKPLPLFKDRSDAGRQLAARLLPWRSKRPLVLALPRGGVPVAFEAAKALGTTLDTLVVRKIGAPDNPEFGVGALAPGDVIMIDTTSLEATGMPKRALDPIIEVEMREMERRMLHYRSGQYAADADSRTDVVILIDDGVATGISARAAIESTIMREKPMKIIFATPVCDRHTARALRNLVDVVCVREVDDLVSIGRWYEDFPQVSDEEVVTCLEAAKAGFA